MREVWKPVPGYEGWYDVSSLGRVRRIKKARGTSCGILRLKAHTLGYAVVGLSRNRTTRSFLVHRLVCLAFHGKPSKGAKQVNHKNGEPLDNRAPNLEWMTPSQNVRHANENGISARVLTPADVITARKRYAKGDVTQAALAEEYGVQQGHMTLIVTGKSWADVGGPITKTGKGTKQRKIDIVRARRLRADGWSFARIAEDQEMSPGAVRIALVLDAARQ